MTSGGPIVTHYAMSGTLEYFYAQDVPMSTVLRAAALWIEGKGADKATGMHVYPELGGFAAQVWMEG